MTILIPVEPQNNVVLVCGGRKYDNVEHVFRVLDRLHKARPIERIIQGGAGGADQLARCWAVARGVLNTSYFANWDADGRKAGPLRNQRMLDRGKPGLVVAFPGGRGTDDMLRRAKAAGVDWMRASADTHAERCDVKQAQPARVGSAVGATSAETPKPSQGAEQQQCRSGR